MDIRPLTKKHQQFAEENHDLVYAFLNKKKLPETIFYDVIIFGYLRAVQEYCDCPRLHNYKFSTLAWKRMQSSLSNYYSYLNSEKRNAHVISLDEPVGSEDGLLWEDIVCYQSNMMEEFEMELLLHDLATALPEREMRIIRMKVDGKRMHEIAKAEHLTFRQINLLLLDAYPTIIKTLYG